ncbi:unnamed protein product [Peronospora farinosa]|uniref:X8 domain-containing protein n=1 Tax=Peronospora farinosa TaxID=134698 RepID=A0ABN8C032_9STRA|nr:unnamed protein product [Peronospora farinosa]
MVLLLVTGGTFGTLKQKFTTKWSFLDLVRQGAFPKNVSKYHSDDEFELKSGLAFACNYPEIDCSDIKKRFHTLEEQCDWAFDQYWHLNREKGATCDFGGTGHLLHVTISTPFAYSNVQEAVGAAIVSVVRWRQLRVRRQYSPIGGHL